MEFVYFVLERDVFIQIYCNMCYHL